MNNTFVITELERRFEMSENTAVSENAFVAIAEMTGLANVEEIINGNVVLIITEPEIMLFQDSGLAEI